MYMIDRIILMLSGKETNEGQIIIEYILMFTIIVFVIIWASTAYIQPSVNKLFEDTAQVINNIGDDFVQNAYRW